MRTLTFLAGEKSELYQDTLQYIVATNDDGHSFQAALADEKVTQLASAYHLQPQEVRDVIGLLTYHFMQKPAKKYWWQ